MLILEEHASVPRQNDIRISTKATRCVFLSVNTAIRIQNKCSVCLWRFYRNQSNWWILSENTPTRMIEKIRKKCVFCCVDQNVLEQATSDCTDYHKLIILEGLPTLFSVFIRLGESSWVSTFTCFCESFVLLWGVFLMTWWIKCGQNAYWWA